MTDEEKNLHQKSENVNKALDLLSQPTVDPKEALNLGKRLKGERAFGYARKLLAHALAHPSTEPDVQLKIDLSQKLALCTYKDPDIPTDKKLDDAFKILNSADPLNATSDQETLGLAGAIYKLKWEYGNNKQYLERSLAYYYRGYLLSKESGWANDLGYTAINVAFVLDLLASHEMAEAEKAGIRSETATKRYAEAEVIRTDIVNSLPPLLEQDNNLNSYWWFLVTIGEAWFGLGKYDEALLWLKKADALPNVPDWERESTARQLACLLRLRTQRGEEFVAERMEAERVLREFLANDAAFVSVLNGKIGLALSGGGFRASLYHIGVLARLAELDVLRHVEVLSCVSGGSIIGAHYYLEVRSLLQTMSQDEISADDYIKIIQRIEKDFLDGVQTNIRTSVAANLFANFKMAFSLGYSRTNRLGDLYEERLYAKVDDDENGKERFLDQLKISPLGERADFSPKEHNWKRTAKAPILILNATTLNTGHNWQFTASWMGEPPAEIDSEIDANDRLRRMYFDDAPEGYKNIRLGYAVAASSCVPGLFESLPLHGLYPEITVRLVDGGVHDNQGSVGLLDQNCNIMLVSDASGQMSSVKQPSSGITGVLLRSKSILEERVRIAQYHELDARRRSSLLQGLMFIHLKKELDVSPVDWIGCKEPSHAARKQIITSYGINKEYQQALAEIRTDLDSFTNNEAYSLMVSGYKMTERYFPLSMPDWTPAEGKKGALWRFLKLADELSKQTTNDQLLKQLKTSSMIAFKVWVLDPALSCLAIGLGAVAIAALGYLCFTSWATVIYRITVGVVASLVLSVLANRLVGGCVWKFFNYRKTLKEVGMGIIVLVVGWLVALMHLRFFDRRYLKLGK